MRYYFKNLWRAIRGKTGFNLVNSEPNTWYSISKIGEERRLGHILTNDDACFIPFIQFGQVFTWDKPLPPPPEDKEDD